MLYSFKVRSIEIALQKAGFLLLLMFCPLLSCSSDHVQPAVVNGSLDLRQWDFKKDGTVFLNGSWFFYWNRFISPAEFAINAQQTGGQSIQVPGVWNKYIAVKYFDPALGYATYFLRTYLPARENMISVKIPTVGTSYICYINGRKAASAGAPGQSAAATVPSYSPVVVNLKDEGSILDIVFHVANFQQHFGGIWFPVEIGLTEDIQSTQQKNAAVDYFIIGILMVMFYFHASLLSVKRTGSLLLNFAAICLLLSIRVLFRGDIYLAPIIPVGFDWLFKIDYLTLSLIAPLALLFFRHLFPEEFSQKISRICMAVFLLFGLIIVFADTLIISRMAFILVPVVNLVILYILFSLVKAAIMGREGARILCVGALLFAISAINDMLYTLQLIKTGYFSEYGIFLFVFAQSIVLSRLFAKTFNMNEKLTIELTRLNQGLEERVLKRTEELENANRKLKEMDKIKSDFFANISHELRTPLTLILSPVEMALKGEKEDFFTSRRFLESIHRNGKGLLSLINNLLDLARIDAGKTALNIEPLDIVQLIHEFKESVWAAALAKNIRLTVESDIESEIIFGDRDKIERICINLLINAVKFTSIDGNILVSFKNEEDSIVISVSDDGPGIPDDAVDTIFDRFNLAADDITKSARGAGVGLSIVKEYVDLHSGTIKVASRHVSKNKKDHGSVFTVHLRKGLAHFKDYAYISKEKKFTSEKFTVIRHSSKGENGSILIVEDNEDLRMFIETILSPPYTVYHASNGKEGLEKIEQHQPDLVITDMMMPVMNGHDMIREMRKNHKHDNLPVLILSARTDDDDLLQGLSHDVDGFLLKPFDYRDLIIIVERLTGKKTY